MARDYTVLNSHHPRAIAPATIHIAHVQLRDLVICPRERGVVNYVQHQAIVEQDLRQKDAPTRTLATLPFSPNSLTSLQTGPSSNDTLLAAGGQEAEIHISYHNPRSSRPVWDMSLKLPGSINNSVLLTSLSLSPSHESSIEPRIGVSNNDHSFRLYDIPLRVHNNKRSLLEVGVVRFDVPINHASISPDGRTLLSVGDSNKVYFHRITGYSSRVDFQSVITLSLPPPEFPFNSLYSGPGSSLAASFSTAFSGDGSKFAVASQEGVVAVWDVRSTKPLKVFQTDKTRVPSSSRGNGSASGWVADDPWEWTRSTRAPGWSVRTVKFNGAQGCRSGREVMTFAEHSNLIHIVDARTFEKDDVIRVPTIHRPPAAHSSRARANISPLRRTHIVSTSRSRSTLPSNTTTTSGSDSSVGASNDAVAGSSTSPVSSQRTPAPPLDISESLPAQAPTIHHSATQSPSSGPVRRQTTTRSATRGRTPGSPTFGRSNASRHRSSSGVLQALSDTFRIELQSESNTLRSRNSTPPPRPQAIPILPSIPSTSPPALSPTSSQGSGRSAYSPPASIGDSTLRTLGGAWPIRSSSNPNPRNLEPASPPSFSATSPPQRPQSPTQVQSSATTRPANRRSNSSHIYVIPPFGDRSMESELTDLVALHGFTSRFGAEVPAESADARGTGSDSASAQTDLETLSGVESAAVDALWDLLMGNVNDGENRPEVNPTSANAPMPSSDLHTMWQPDTAGPSGGDTHADDSEPLTGRVHIARAGQSSDLARLGHYERDYAEPTVVTMMDVDDDNEGHDASGDTDGVGMDVDADGDLDAEFDHGVISWTAADPNRDEDDDVETYADEDEEDEMERGRRIRTSRSTPSNCSSTASSRSPSPLRLAPSAETTTTRRYGNSVGSAGSSTGQRTLFVPYTTSPTDTPIRRHGNLSLPIDGFTPIALPLVPSISSPSKRPSRPKLYHLSKDDLYGYHEELDIAGICFDPSGERLYVANCTPRYKEHNGFGGYGYVGSPDSDIDDTAARVGAIVEWEIKGAEKRWWNDEGWR